MAQIRITKEFTFEMAHALHGYDGACAHVHGHSYHLSVTLRGKPVVEKDHPKLGMVLDFGEIKKIVKASILDVFDHGLVMYDQDPRARQQMAAGTNTVLVPFQPTCENLLADFARRLRPKLPTLVELYALKLRETPTGYAEWYGEDNP